ncbi:MAG: alpha/beta hydrolase [Candidatus Brocadiaceae bacterium]|nr:alpha/beta hydrolase [Candidatus Brocadiaceae bacterium]
MNSIKENWLQVDNLDIRYFVTGNGDLPVILLHGGGTNSAMLSWKNTIIALSQEHRVYAPDWPCYGESSSYHGEYTTELLIKCLGLMMDAWHIPIADLIGLSMGGCAAIGYTLLAPERVNNLVLVSGYGFQQKAPYHRLSYLLLRTPFLYRFIWLCMRKSPNAVRFCLQNIIHESDAVSDDLVKEVFQMAQRPSIEQSFFSWLRNEVLWTGMNTCYLDKLHEIRARTLLIHGEQDPLVPVKYAYQASQHIPHARLHVMRGCGHWLTRESPDEFNRILKKFLVREGC